MAFLHAPNGYKHGAAGENKLPLKRTYSEINVPFCLNICIFQIKQMFCFNLIFCFAQNGLFSNSKEPAAVHEVYVHPTPACTYTAGFALFVFSFLSENSLYNI